MRAMMRQAAPAGSGHVKSPSLTPAAMTSVRASFQRRSSRRDTFSNSGTRIDSDQQSIHIAHDLEEPVGAYHLRILRTFSNGVALDVATASSRFRSCSAAQVKAC